MAPPGTHSPRPHPPCITSSLLTSLRIFNIPVGEKKKRLKLSLNWSGTRARPSARFWMAAFSASVLGAGGCLVGVLELASCGALGATFLGCTDGPEREGASGAAAAPGRAERGCCCKLPAGVLVVLACMVGSGAWLCQVGCTAAAGWPLETRGVPQRLLAACPSRAPAFPARGRTRPSSHPRRHLGCHATA